ncbi:MAG: hypothetical protein ACQEVQ_10575 [Pseudomonadota bacterium]
MKKKNTQPLKQQLIRKLASRWWYFFDGKNWFNAQGKKLSNAPKGFVIVVLARHCYRSQQSTWPIKSSRELKQVLKQKQPASLHWVKAYNNNQRVVNSINIDAATQAQLNNAQCIIPEHWLVNKAQKNNSFWQLETPAGSWFSAKQGSEHNHSVLAGVIKSAATAKASLGVADDLHTETLTWDDYHQRLVDAMPGLTPGQWQSVWKPAGKQRTELNWKAIGLTLASVVGLYAVLSTGYLYYLDYSRTQQLQAFGEQVDERLQERSQMQRSVNRIRALSQLSADQEQLLANWNLIGFLYLNQVEITRMDSQLDQLEITGRAESATDIAEKLTQLDSVSSVTFSSPVRRSQNQEVFTLEVKLEASGG